MAEPLLIEGLEGVGVEPGLRDRVVAGELVVEGQVGVAGVEVALPLEGQALPPAGDGVEDGPPQQGLDEPGEVEVQARDLAVGAGVGEVDGVAAPRPRAAARRS